MTDTPSRIIGLACVLIGVWIVTYWVYTPSRGPNVTLGAAPTSTAVQPPSPPAPAQPALIDRLDSALHSPPSSIPAAPPVRMRRVQKLLPPEYRDYLVQKGDTSFERIAARKEVFGNARLGDAIARSNKFTDPTRLKPGVTTVRIPVDPENTQGKLVWVDEPAPDEEQPQSPVAPPLSPPARVAAELKTYTIQKDDTLWDISKKFYGKGALWRTIAEANKDVMPNPDRPPSGVSIRIPPAPSN
jgi:nucleoid-associated protein YgaU